MIVEKLTIFNFQGTGEVVIYYSLSIFIIPNNLTFVNYKMVTNYYKLVTNCQLFNKPKIGTDVLFKFGDLSAVAQDPSLPYKKPKITGV